MASRTPVLYFDLGSPYAYLAVERAESVLGQAPELEPVLLGAIFARRGFGSWSATSARELRVQEIEARARRYGLAPLAWPSVWPANGLRAMRWAVWAKQRGALEQFAKAVFRKQFAEAADIASSQVLGACAEQAGLSAPEALAAAERNAVKQALREATDAAWDAGARGVPALAVDGAIFYGDDQLELAAAALAR